MNIKKYILSLPVVLLCVASLSSCTDWLDTKPKDKQDEALQFSTKDGFYSAVNGIYNRMSDGALYGEYMSYSVLDLLGQCYTVEQVDENSYYEYLRALTDWNYNNESVESALNAMWNSAYQTVMNINVVLKNIEKDNQEVGILPFKEYQMLKGEMLATRAMLHFDMLRLFGPIYAKKPEGRGIPYNESTETKILDILPAQTVLNDYIIRDLKEAQQLLLESDPVIEFGPRAEFDEVYLDNSQRYRQLRLNYYATTLLTARAYLWAGDYANALTEARKLTDDKKLREFFPAVDAGKLLGNTVDPDRMFSTECLFGMYNKDRGVIYDNVFGGPNTAKKLLIPRSNYVDGQLYAGAEGSDYRYQSLWENGQTLEDNPSKKLLKFKEIKALTSDKPSFDGEKDETTDLMAQSFHGTFCSLMKLSEAYYIAAEALATPESPVYDLNAAWEYMKTIRACRGVSTPGGNEVKFFDTLTKEYIREFIGEGQIFFYFKRLNKGFDNAYNGRKELLIMVNPGFPPFIPPTYDDKDKATDEQKEKRFVAPLPKSEIENR